jgi:hypothetical protein
MRPARVIVWLALMLIVTGCSLLPAPFDATGPGNLPPDIAAAHQAWQASDIASYTMDVEFLCFCALTGAVTIDVRDGKVTSVIQEGAKVDPARVTGFPLTIDAMYARIGAVIAQGGTVTAQFDPNGVPSRIELDPVPNAIDDELTIGVRQVVPTD